MGTFSALLALCAGNSPVNSPHKGQWRGALMFSLICTEINGWVNNREVGDLRSHRTHYDVIVMMDKSHESGNYDIRYNKTQQNTIFRGYALRYHPALSKINNMHAQSRRICISALNMYTVSLDFLCFCGNTISSFNAFAHFRNQSTNPNHTKGEETNLWLHDRPEVLVFTVDPEIIQNIIRHGISNNCIVKLIYIKSWLKKRYLNQTSTISSTIWRYGEHQPHDLYIICKSYSMPNTMCAQFGLLCRDFINLNWIHLTHSAKYFGLSKTHLPLNKMAAISQMIFSCAFSWMESSLLWWKKTHWSLFLRVQLTITQHWFR